MFSTIFKQLDPNVQKTLSMATKYQYEKQLSRMRSESG